MLFATLDTSVRKVKLQTKKNFIDRIRSGLFVSCRHHLVKAFRSTLEEARDADLLLHVVDVSQSGT